MPGVGLALMAVGDLAVIGLGVIEELLEIVRGEILPRDDDQRIGRESTLIGSSGRGSNEALVKTRCVML